MSYTILVTNKCVILLTPHHWMRSERLATSSCKPALPIPVATSHVQSNYMMNIVECLRPEGVLLPGMATQVPFVFSPREAKTYIVSLYIPNSAGNTDNCLCVCVTGWSVSQVLQWGSCPSHIQRRWNSGYGWGGYRDLKTWQYSSDIFNCSLGTGKYNVNMFCPPYISHHYHVGCWAVIGEAVLGTSSIVLCCSETGLHT